ncbi:MAG: helix-turn-helix domain-containing protein [Actinomycetota bacterium]
MDGRAIDHVVDRLWSSEAVGAAGTEVRLPTGRAQLVFGLDPGFPVAILQGPTTMPAVIERGPQRRAVGVALQPSAVRALTGEHAAAFTDRSVSLGELWRTDVSGLIEELRDAQYNGSIAAVLARVIEAEVGARASGSSSQVRRGIELLRCGVAVADVVDRLGTRRSTFVAAFRAEVGITPKAFSRLARFESAVAQVRAVDAPGLASIAAVLGYADQAHMTRDFAEFAGRSPGALHGDGSGTPNHLAHR